MSDRDQPLPSPARIETQVERVLLFGVPAENHAELLPLLRSPDRIVREAALILIHLDREDALRQCHRQRPQVARPSGVPVTKHAELQPLLQSSDRSVREMARVLIHLDHEEAAQRSPCHRPSPC